MGTALLVVGYAVAAAVSFAATNIDDFVVLLVFFSQAATEKHPRSHVVLGQVLGFTVIVGFSLIGMILHAVLPTGYIGLIGFVPILMGCKGLYDLAIEKGFCTGCYDLAFARTRAFSCVSVSLDSDRKEPFLAIEQIRTEDEKEEQEPNCLARGFDTLLGSVLSPFVLKVGTTTIANGGDNISIYLPLFASAPPSMVPVILIVFYVLLFVWCAASYGMLQCRVVADGLSEYGGYLVPFLLIGLGLYILSASVLFTL